MSKRSFLLITAFGLIASLAFGTPSQAAAVYTTSVTIASDTVTVTDNGGTGHFSASTLAGGGTAPTAPSLAGASDAIGGYNLTYSGGSFPPDYAFISGVVTYDVTLKDVASSDTHTFVVTATFSNVISSNLNPGTPGLTVTGSDSATIGGFVYRLNATSTGTNINVPGTAIYVGFESQAVPEPTSMSLLGIGMAGFFAFRRYFNKRNADV